MRPGRLVEVRRLITRWEGAPPEIFDSPYFEKTEDPHNLIEVLTGIFIDKTTGSVALLSPPKPDEKVVWASFLKKIPIVTHFRIVNVREISFKELCEEPELKRYRDMANDPSTLTLGERAIRSFVKWFLSHGKQASF